MNAPRPHVRPRVGITLGDPRGIGPEVTRKALHHPTLASAAEYVLIGPTGTTPPTLPRAGSDLRFENVGAWTPGSSSEAAGHLAGASVARAVELAMRGEIDALVTAPIEKSAFQEGGWRYPGHTEMLQALTGARAVAMMMAAERTRVGGSLRVVLATTHIPLREVANMLTPGLLVEQATLTRDALRESWRIESPRLALCAFNPHASDHGLFGDEEERIYGPALATLSDAKFAVTGPVPADTVFARALAGEFDAVIAPYHDVGMAPFKTVSFGRGVNVTLGLPFPRTSPDHGTALDIAGRDIADASSMIEAIQLCVRLAARFDTVRAGP